MTWIPSQNSHPILQKRVDRRRLLGSALLGGLATLSTSPAGAVPDEAAQTADSDVLARIIDQAVNHSEVMSIARHLDDTIGARLTGSPSAHKAEDWARDTFARWGLANARKEGFAFGRGWWIETSSARMTWPRPLDLSAVPIAWSPPTPGTITAEIVVAPMADPADFARWRGKLGGKIVLVNRPVPAPDQEGPVFVRRSDADLARANRFEFPDRDVQARRIAYVNLDFWRKLDAFLASEKAVAMLTLSRRDGKLLHGEGYRYAPGDTALLPQLEMAQEDYLRLVRLAEQGLVPKVALNSAVHFDDSDPQAYNVLAEIQGSDPNAGYVMAGAHLDSWAAGDGAADDGGGVTVVMEAARILKRIGLRPRRTIRFALWSGEEQGLRGSLAYTEANLARRGAEGDDPDTGIDHFFKWPTRWPVVPLAGFYALKAYFNLDHGGGRIRGLFAERDPALIPIFRDWLAPFEAMGAANVFINDGGTGTDHYAMRSVGLPAFGFMQDNLDYGRITHSNADTLDHLKPDDMRQSSMVLAWVLVRAANMASDLPRPPLPTRPND